MFKKDNKTKGRRSPAGRSFSAGRDAMPTMHRTKCTECGNICDVPFKPNGKKPVLCSHCFGLADKAGTRAENPGLRRINESGKETFSAICDSCGKSCGVPFRPNGKKPVLCSLCFAQENAGDNKRERPDFKPKNNQLDIINEKLDRILKTLDTLSK